MSGFTHGCLQSGVLLARLRELTATVGGGGWHIADAVARIPS
jgi:hypothetical protein